MAFLGQEEQIREFQDRFKFVHIILFIGMGIILSRLVYLQILQGDQLRKVSEENRIKQVKIKAPRGMIYDRNKTLLIDNRPAFDLEITPQYLKAKDRKKVIEKLSSIINMPEEKILKKLRKAKHLAKFRPVKIKTDLSRDEVAKIETWKLMMPGVSVETEIQRTSIYGDIATHMLGYIGEVNRKELRSLRKKYPRASYSKGDYIGKVGIEKKYDQTLRGTDGLELIEVDALGRRIRKSNISGVLSQKYEGTPSIPGKNLVLTIDQDLQLAAKEAFGDRSGALVAIDPRNGQILSMISRPSFDATSVWRGFSNRLWKELNSNSNHPMIDKTIQEHYSPGSVFKIISAIAGLEEGVIKPRTHFHCPGKIKVGRRTVHCWKQSGHGDVDITSAMEQSCNIFFLRLAQRLKSVDVLAKWANAFGLGKRTQIPLDREIPGLIPTEAWKLKTKRQPWVTGETLSVSIGQSYVLTTPIQLATFIAAIANGGKIYQPYFLKQIEAPDGTTLKEFKPLLRQEVNLSPKTLDLIKKGLWKVVNGKKGTARLSVLPGMDFSGKTGTAQHARKSADQIYEKCQNLKYELRHTGIFAGYAPKDDPVIAIAMIGEHTCSGSSGAAPVAKEVIRTYLKKYFPDKYKDPSLAQITVQPVSTGEPTP